MELFSKPNKSSRSLHTIILVWAILLGLFWMTLILIAHSHSVNKAVVNINAHPTIKPIIDTNSNDVFTEIDEVNEPMLLTIVKQAATFVSVNIIGINVDMAYANAPVATIGIRG